MRESSVLEVDLNKLDSNILKLKKNTNSKNEIIFMVKANAYGHGLNEIIHRSHKNGIRNFGLASVHELSDELINSYKDSRFIVFSDVSLNSNLYSNKNLVPVLSSVESCSLFFSINNFKSREIFIKIDTGMNRLGISLDEIGSLFDLLKKNNIKVINHLMTHFSNSYLKISKNSKTELQYDRFKNIKSDFLKNDFKILETSCSNSGAIEQGFGLEETHIRPGLMLYGPASYGIFNKDVRWDGELISSLKSKIVSIKSVKAGDEVGYGSTEVKSDGQLIYLPVGYGDGFRTSYKGSEFILNDGCRGQVFGRVSMDLTCIFIDDSQTTNLEENSWLTIWDSMKKKNLDQLCKISGLIPYEVFTSINDRVMRKYIY